MSSFIILKYIDMRVGNMDNKDFLVTSLREEELDKIKKYRKYSDFLFLINVILKSTLLVVFVLLYKEYLRGSSFKDCI